jgi:16S rRNA (uracil1498-N3)-methyltransferase
MIIEKGTELGVNTFYLFSSKNSQYFTTNIGHWEKIARQAIKQSLRFHLPEIYPLAEFISFLESVENYQYKYLADQNASINMMKLIKDLNLNNGDKVIFAIGPEGGFTEKEIQIAQDNGFIPVSMGDYRLRTETAVLSVAAYLNLFRN